MTLSQDKGAHFLAVIWGKDWSSQLACYATMTSSRLHVKTSNVRHTGQTRLSSTPEDRTSRSASTAETHLQPSSRGSEPRTSARSSSSSAIKRMGMPILRISRKLANIKVQTRPPLRPTLVQTESSARQFVPRSQEPSPDTQLGNPSNLLNELLLFGYTFSVVPYRVICVFPPACPLLPETVEAAGLVRD
jgi:hypothetical protein